ncbi:MAG: metal ABC transporter ATP-binding protein [Candidatus Omnitrophota bacterium]|jgi:zinc transport system ATP-binding protein
MTQKLCVHCCTRIENLNVSFGAVPILTNINLHVDCGELVAIVGPNGAGKTTLLRAMLGEITYSGSINYQVKGLPDKKPRIGYVPQKLNYDLDSPISVLDFIATAISNDPVWLGVKPTLKEKIKSSLSAVSAEHLLNKRIGELSGGELQRMLLAMAMTPEPDLLLLDEPMSGVDAKGLSLFYEIAGSLRKVKDVTILLITHDLIGVAPHADRMVLLNNSIIASGRPEEMLSDERLIKALGPSLWNISKLPELMKEKGRS